ncbi:hypothetical protein T484DRAFT_1820426 [Baffinella frigidus]|nr:hypothetical protein T484DRAFT_1820426 [Cryptophyta sp. CCMP2293]
MFLEAPVTGSKKPAEDGAKKPAEDGALVFLCAGDKALYDAVVPCLEVMGKKHMFLGEVGAGANMKLYAYA